MKRRKLSCRFFVCISQDTSRRYSMRNIAARCFGISIVTRYFQRLARMILKWTRDPHRSFVLSLNLQNEDGGWGLHVEGNSVMFCTALNYICLRMLGEGPNGGRDNSCKRARQWILDHGGVTYIPSWGKFWLSVISFGPYVNINSKMLKVLVLILDFSFVDTRNL